MKQSRYPASEEDLENVCCFLAFQEIKDEPRKKTIIRNRSPCIQTFNPICIRETKKLQLRFYGIKQMASRIAFKILNYPTSSIKMFHCGTIKKLAKLLCSKCYVWSGWRYSSFRDEVFRSQVNLSHVEGLNNTFFGKVWSMKLSEPLLYQESISRCLDP